MVTSTFLQPYPIYKPRHWVLHDRETRPTEIEKQTLLFHIECGDYFGTLATILNFLKDHLDPAVPFGKTELMRERAIHTLESQVQHLIFLQKNYTIIDKNKNKEK